MTIYKKWKDKYLDLIQKISNTLSDMLETLQIPLFIFQGWVRAHRILLQ